MKKLLQAKAFWLYLVSLLLLAVICRDGVLRLLKQWQQPDYSHGYIIPLVCIYMLWRRRAEIAPYVGQGGYFGILLLLGSLLVWFLGEGSALLALTQYAFFCGVVALAVLWLGLRGALIVWAPLVYLIFMIPLPDFLHNNLSSSLQLISSAWGVAIIRLFGVSVFLEGNIIDLGVYQLQVVEACSGLRYLFPLVSFGYLVAYIYRGPMWQKLIIFLSTVPITLLMNSVRIGIIGVTVEYFGISAAEGVLHDFEGWVVFMACLVVLIFEIWLFYCFSKTPGMFWDRFDFEFGSANRASVGLEEKPAIGRHTLVGALVLVIAVPFSYYFTEKQGVIPERESFITFPLFHEGWLGREEPIDSLVLQTLKATDYFIATYRRNSAQPMMGADRKNTALSQQFLPVNLYMAYYASQRKRASAHSPRSCIPGDGWEIMGIKQVFVPLTPEASNPLRVNRVLIQRGEARQLVYYWFQQRGRVITNEYLAKWYIFWDSLTRNRTDGALVRLIVPVPEGFRLEEAERQLQGFLRGFHPLLGRYLPD